MNKTFICSLIGATVICVGFTLFYLLKILPVEQNIAYTQSTIRMYKQTVASNQKAILQNKKDLEARKKQIQREEALGRKVNRSILPLHPDIEKFFTSIQEEAGDLGVTVASIEKVQQSSDTSSNTGNNKAKKSSRKTERALQNLLTANTYTLTLNADRELPLLTYIGYLESRKRLLTIDQLNWQQNPDTQSAASSDSSTLQQGSSDTSGSSGSLSSSGSSQPDSSGTSTSDSSSAVPDQPQYTATLTMTLYSAKK